MTVTLLEATPSEGIATLDAPVARAKPDAALPVAKDRAGHLALLDGLRAYLATWVLVCHAMWVSGFECDKLNAVCSVVCSGAHAVDVFVLLSGFVIFKLLDARSESYRVFLMRRSLRLYPVYILLFLLAIPASHLAAGNLALATHYFTAAHAAELAAQYRAWFDDIGWHSLMHVSMLHGLVPRSILPESPGAFLEPAWSISLEWQFYVIAPLAYALATSRHTSRRIAISLAALIAFVLAAAGFIPSVDFGAALPFHAEYFYLGAASYFLYRRTLSAPISRTPALVSFVTSLFVFQLGHRYPGLIPICMWVVVLGMLLERGDNPWVSVLARPLLHPFAQFLGRISYSLYLCHMILLYVVQYVVLRVAPGLDRTTHCIALIVLTFTLAVPVSALLFRYVEEPAIRLGRAIKERRAPKPVLQSAAE